jgi:hypothetical protein
LGVDGLGIIVGNYATQSITHEPSRSCGNESIGDANDIDCIELALEVFGKRLRTLTVIILHSRIGFRSRRVVCDPLHPSQSMGGGFNQCWEKDRTLNPSLFLYFTFGLCFRAGIPRVFLHFAKCV